MPDEYTPEPWVASAGGANVLDAEGNVILRDGPYAFPGDLRRAVAAVNASRGIPTEVLEEWARTLLTPPAAPEEVKQ